MPKGGYKAGGGRPRKANSRRSLMEEGRQAMAAAEAPEALDETSASAQPENLDPLAYMLAGDERSGRRTRAAGPDGHRGRTLHAPPCNRRGKRHEGAAGREGEGGSLWPVHSAAAAQIGRLIEAAAKTMDAQAG